MYKRALHRTLFFGFFLPLFAYAQTIGTLFDAAIFLISGLIPLLIAIAVLVFFWGIVKFIFHADDERAVEEGKQLMVWGMIAIFVMVALWSILGYFQQELGLTSSNLGVLPQMPDFVP